MRTSHVLRWTVPLGVGGVLAAAALLPSSQTASAEPALPARSAAQLLADVAGSRLNALSGTVVQTARLGLPELPAQASSGTSPLALISGSHTLKVWLDGPQRQRLALIGQLAEYDVVRNNRDVWTYTSETNKVAHVVLPAKDTRSTGSADTGRPGDPRSYATPGAAADAALKAVGPTTVVSVDRTARVAGRPAYQLVLAPRDTRSLVTSVRIALDSATKTPLRVQVWGSRDRVKPALEVGFTDVRFRRPAASVFAFTPPPGASVQQVPLPEGRPGAGARMRDSTRPAVVGTGWTAVVALGTGSPSAPSAAPSRSDSVLLSKLTTPVAGGRVLKTALLSVLFTDDGRTLVGAVAPERLQQVAGSQR